MLPLNEICFMTRDAICRAINFITITTTYTAICAATYEAGYFAISNAIYNPSCSATEEATQRAVNYESSGNA